MKKTLLFIVCLSFSCAIFAHTDYKNEGGVKRAPVHADYKNVATAYETWWSPSRLYLGAYGGYGDVSGAYKQDGQVAQGRLALGLRAAEYYKLIFGVEAGLQSGNTMRLDAASSLIAAAGGLPIQSTLKPLLDVLITVKGQLLSSYPLFGLLKGGIAYRQLVLENRTSAKDDLRKVNAELQAGLAYNLTNHVVISAFYQGIYSGANAGLHLNTVGDVNMTRIPKQQAGFLGLEYSV